MLDLLNISQISFSETLEIHSPEPFILRSLHHKTIILLTVIFATKYLLALRFPCNYLG